MKSELQVIFYRGHKVIISLFNFPSLYGRREFLAIGTAYVVMWFYFRLDVTLFSLKSQSWTEHVHFAQGFP